MHRNFREFPEVPKLVTFNLSKKQIMYDISSITYLTDRSRKVGGTPEEKKASSYVNIDSEEIDTIRINRLIAAASHMVTSKLAAYSPVIEITEDTTSINISCENDFTHIEDLFVFRLEMTEYFNELFCSQICDSIHNFMVNYAIYKWYMLTNPSEASIYFNLSEDYIETARGLLHKRTKRTQRIRSTF